MSALRSAQIRRGDLLRPGVDSIPEKNRLVYRLSYLGLIIGIALLITSRFSDALNMEGYLEGPISEIAN